MSAAVSGVSELVLEVADLEESERFYTRALGLTVVARPDNRSRIWLMAGEGTRIGLWLPQEGLAGARGGAHVHFALHISDSDFDDAVDRIRSFGLEPQINTHRPGLRRKNSRSAYVEDPDGNCVELWTRDVARYLA